MIFALFTPCRLQNVLAGHHHAKVDDFEVVALQDDANDILANVVDVAFDRRHHDLAVGLYLTAFLFLDERHEVTDSFLHYPRRFDHLRQKHLAGTEQIANNVHAGHQRPFDNVKRPIRAMPRLFRILYDKLIDSVDQCMFQTFFDRFFAPDKILRPLAARSPGLCNFSATASNLSVAFRGGSGLRPLPLCEGPSAGPRKSPAARH